MSKFCNNGHQMEDAWEICPFCQKTGYAGPTPSTSKTRVDMFPGPPSTPVPVSPAAAPPPRKTVLISEQQRAPVVGWLVAMNGSQRGRDFRIHDGQNVLGSAPDADVQLSDPTVSGKHASLRYKDGKFFLVDLDSSNGTFLNSNPEPIAREELHDNDTIRAGELILKFKCL
ncbi:MAG: FHA domain-containing protein [Candidatus Sulfotelmatobacter sp.]